MAGQPKIRRTLRQLQGKNQVSPNFPSRWPRIVGDNVDRSLEDIALSEVLPGTQSYSASQSRRLKNKLPILAFKFLCNK